MCGNLCLDSLLYSMVYVSIFMPIVHCFNYCSFIVSLKIKQCQPSSFVLFQSCLGSCMFSVLSEEFQNQFVNFYKSASEILIAVALNLEMNLRKLTSTPRTHLFRPFKISLSNILQFQCANFAHILSTFPSIFYVLNAILSHSFKVLI